MQERLRPIMSLPFIICLGLLLLNDFYLKAVYHNILTGKLSDLCGLFIFPIFWSVLKPKYRSQIFIATAVFFIYWKSAYSQSFIDFFSSAFFRIERTVDVTDLLTLPVLALAWFSLKNDLEHPKASAWQHKFNPYGIAAIAVFSFYSTSQPRYTQRFDQPQYVLLKSNISVDSTDYNEFHYYKFDSLLAVKIDEISMSQRPAKDDDYNKNAEIKNLDQSILQMLGNEAHLIAPGTITSLRIKTAEGEDSVRFNGGRLDGKFTRKKDGKIIIEGFYKMGLEDSLWIFRDAAGHVNRKITFVNGERTKIQHFKNNMPVKSENIYTRSDTVRDKGIQIIILILLLAATVFLIIRNYRQSPEKLEIQKVWKWLLCLGLPFLVWGLHFAITLLLGDYQHDIFVMFGMAVLTYLITCPLFFIVVFWIKFSKQIDILWYILLFALCFSIWIEINIFMELSA
ncbi:hypothetical protein MKJ01_09415 [Chryseobacterium sp. SSA4.19]|uniref:hypothetical protein n=1 Tax=Chryseobacterium sp. SSA4.19 TaxID=2919915 RepID=UPI001F4EDBC7|nr:hypothetical protein [Chryseobacterium sp. SSA4.19]MCJ8153974.1 hypothetical protein [Chryseobacterium sp. SSA4.19]